MFGLIGIAARVGLVLFGYWQARKFVQTRLRYVDAVHNPMAPLLAGFGAAVVACPLIFVPFLGFSILTPLAFGTFVALGVANGARQVRRRIGA